MDIESKKQKNNLHIGMAIRDELQRQERTVSWFARKLNCDRSNIYKLFKRSTIDTELLLRVSSVLQHDFFAVYQDLINGVIGNNSVDT